MQDDEITIERAARAVPCDVETLRKWLQQGHITGRDNFGRCDRQITKQSAGIVLSLPALRAHCAKIGIVPDFRRT